MFKNHLKHIPNGKCHYQSYNITLSTLLNNFKILQYNPFILSQYYHIQENIINGSCDEIIKTKTRIMAVPWSHSFQLSLGIGLVLLTQYWYCMLNFCSFDFFYYQMYKIYTYMIRKPLCYLHSYLLVFK